VVDNPPAHAIAARASNHAAAHESNSESSPPESNTTPSPSEVMELELLARLAVMILLCCNSAGAATAHATFIGYISTLIMSFEGFNLDESNSK
jgi:hypothetical protein